MAIIGKFSEHVDPQSGEVSYRGGISFGGVDVALRIVPNGNRKNENSPEWIIADPASGKYADDGAGVGFSNTTQDGRKYIGLRVDTSKFREPLDCAMWPGRDPGVHLVVWRHPAKAEAQDAA